jgi:hypothetical protein
MDNFVIQKLNYNKKHLHEKLSTSLELILNELPLDNSSYSDLFDDIEIKGVIFKEKNYELSICITPHSYFLNVKYASSAPRSELEKVFDALRGQLEKL